MAGFPAGGTIFAANLNAIGIPVAPTATGTNGTVTAGTTETRDAVLGNYQFTALAGVRYRVTFTGRGISGSVAADTYLVGVRNGGASTPTAASPLVGHQSKVFQPTTGTNAATGITHVATFIPGAGTVTLAVFWVRSAGTGVGIPVGGCELFAEAIGFV